MEKNTACISLDEYSKLLCEWAYYRKESERWKELHDEVVDERQQLVSFIVKELCDEYKLKRFSLEKLIDVTDYAFPLRQDAFKELMRLSVTYEELIDEITARKEYYDESHKEEQDGNE